MGLSLSAAKNLKFIKKQSDISDDEADEMYNNNIHLYVNDMVFEQSDGMETGFYEGEYITDLPRLGWSYSGYNQWRKELIEFAGYKDAGDIQIRYDKINRDIKIGNVLNEENKTINLKFAELCYFSDCEGFIGPKTSAKLYKDFENNLEAYKKFARVDWYVDSYQNMMKYFKVASENNGVVLFH